MRQRLDTMSAKIEALKAKLKQRGVKHRIKITEELIGLMNKTSALSDIYDQRAAFAEDMAMLLTEAGVAVDDRTFVEKMARLKNPREVASAAKEVYEGAKGIYALIKNIKDVL